jgi:hypothetical protein
MEIGRKNEEPVQRLTDPAPDPTRRSKTVEKGRPGEKQKEIGGKTKGRRLGLGHQVNNKHPGWREAPHNGEAVEVEEAMAWIYIYIYIYISVCVHMRVCVCVMI